LKHDPERWQPLPEKIIAPAKKKRQSIQPEANSAAFALGGAWLTASGQRRFAPPSKLSAFNLRI
jgi:hypothetical protein